MDALTPLEAYPLIRVATAKKLYDLINTDIPELLKEKIKLQGAAITIHVWQGALDKEVTNETDAQDTIGKIEKLIENYKKSCTGVI